MKRCLNFMQEEKISSSRRKSSRSRRRHSGPEYEHRVNQQIRVLQVRVIDADGEQLGIMHPRDGYDRAQEQDMDLVEVAPNADPPVCRIMDYGKYRYKQSKRENKSKSDRPSLKTIRLRPKTDDHDLQVKMRKAKDFLDNGDKVKFVVQMRGRERYLTERWIEQLTDNLHELGEQFAQEDEQLKIIQSPKG